MLIALPPYHRWRPSYRWYRPIFPIWGYRPPLPPTVNNINISTVTTNTTTNNYTIYNYNPTVNITAPVTNSNISLPPRVFLNNMQSILNL